MLLKLFHRFQGQVLKRLLQLEMRRNFLKVLRRLQKKNCILRGLMLHDDTVRKDKGMADLSEFLTPCHFGTESVLKKEITDLGYEIKAVEDGKVSFFRSVAIKTRKEAISFSQLRPQMFWVIKAMMLS